MKIAIVGAGISGLSAAYVLGSKHEVVLFEKDDRLGGHAHTVGVTVNGNEYFVDTGAVGFSKETYPNLTKLFEYLDVPLHQMPMRWGASIDDGAFEYSSRFPGGAFADWQLMFRTSFCKFIY
jgi:predicted NAD/FAD-binding protein